MTSRYAAPILRDGRNFFHALPRCAPRETGRNIKNLYRKNYYIVL